ncbi:AraC family transcriptional regulator [Paenibacillus thalictri]|uniref:AraC family transcriptional regulator n=2 Tax=Paenibacillus thalictri TaxID=2527873 RepID=A0A4Q9DZR1_9BACL|nr:AraC family transcriptional regulator [Paenibacillus thalictri]
MHVFSHLGIMTFFCWSDQELAVIPQESAAVPMVYSPSTRMNELQEVWISLIRALEFYWYEDNEGLSKTVHCSSPGQTAAYFLHGEMELVRQFEQGQLDVCIRWIKRMWEQMKTESWPIPKVKHMAVQLRREMARLAQAGDPDDRQVDGFVRHRQLEAWMLDQLKLDLELYMRHTKMWSDHPEINKIIDYINQHYAQNITLRFMAQYVALDENYVSSLFKKKTGESLIHYVQRTRVEQAKALLLETESPVSDIGLRVGFENDNYFIKIFRRFMDVTPSQYRKSANQ